jgi:hypothetical protein
MDLDPLRSICHVAGSDKLHTKIYVHNFFKFILQKLVEFVVGNLHISLEKLEKAQSILYN